MAFVCMAFVCMMVDQIMRNLWSSQIVEMRRALRNQAVDINRQHHSEAEWLAQGNLIIARDRAQMELGDLQEAHADLQVKVRKEKRSKRKKNYTTPFGVNLMRSQVSYWAAQGLKPRSLVHHAPCNAT